MQLLIALMVAFGTFVQAVASIRDLGQAKKPAVAWMDAEDQLVAEQPRLRRRGARRDLKGERDREVHRDIVHVKWVITSWSVLFVASLMAAYDAAFG